MIHRSRQYGGPDCGVGTGAELGPGVMLLDRTRLPGKAMLATVGAGATVGGGAVIAGVKVGEGAYGAAGEPKRSVRTSRVPMRTRVSSRVLTRPSRCWRRSRGDFEVLLDYEGEPGACTYNLFRLRQ